MPRIHGFHHITAIAGDPASNVRFYTGMLGLRLVKVTVNFDDPGSYHLYYGSGQGTPGSILTFFPWAHASPGVRSTGETSTVALAIPAGAAAFWKERLLAAQLAFAEAAGTLTLADPDGLSLQLVEAASVDPALRWDEGPVAPEHAIHGIHHVVLDIHAPEVADTERVLEQQLGIAPGQLAQIASVPTIKRGRMGPGIVHHIAWRAPDDAEQSTWRQHLLNAGLHVTPVQDRQYFHSIYFREPGGVLYEIATENPGFLTDESYEQLGRRLQLPPWLEPRRSAIAAALPPLPQPGLLQNEPCPA